MRPNHLSALLIVLTAGGALAELPRYTLISLPELPGGRFCSCMTPRAISDNGNIAGQYFSPEDSPHAFSIIDGAPRDLGTLGAERSNAYGVNNVGQSVGSSKVAESLHRAFVELDGVMTQLPGLGGISANAFDINDAGVIVGTAGDPVNNTRAVVWGLGGDEPRVIPTFGGEFNRAHAVNEAGAVVGWAWTADRTRRAYLWTVDGGIVDLGALASGSSEANGVNDAGQIVGVSSLGNDGTGPMQRAFIHEGGVMRDLGLVPEAGTPGGIFGPAYVRAIAHAVNNTGQVVGVTLPRPDDIIDANAAVLWMNGEATLLDHLIDPGSGWTLTDAFDINDAGVIIGRGLEDGESKGFMLVPIASCPADVNGDGVIDFFDVGAFLAAFGAGDLSVDFNGDGVIDLFDVGEFLAAYAAGCP